jgi:thiol-disulfide isomerase/thioredoxin
MLSVDGLEWILFVFQHFNCDDCRHQLPIWEQFASAIKDIVKVARLDATQAPNLLDQFGVTDIPTWLSVRQTNGTYRTRVIGRTFKSSNAAINAVFAHWHADLHFVQDGSRWLSQAADKTRFLLMGDDEDSFVDFKSAAAALRSKSEFAIAKKEGNITVAVMRGRVRARDIIGKRGRRLINEMEELAPPVFPTLSDANFVRICGEWCVGVVANDVDAGLVKAMTQLPYNTALMPVEFGKRANLTAGDWFAAVGTKVWRTRNLSDVNGFLIFCEDLYKSENPAEVMPKSGFVVVTVGESGTAVVVVVAALLSAVAMSMARRWLSGGVQMQEVAAAKKE